ncbi:SMI1/KNR4 family protein (plasmid) [Exiguobacterium sp. N4-1P]|uniref:SMI1/KNR4 family protein n=1 Tax=Exiguobacterium sp. N4-1P TaxID=2051906 RepID=UPI000B58B91B|nr:SMI1/KNR4 family protein [Exiguobacterium sp. N4-1P]ASI35212.1 SMI1/KNR4 family protein [Exiguobacterium sp. N4-1P]ASI37225.1 SMI1/KNR4 family protein [Exiguobacterium sp. N4-1P]
MSKLIKRLHPDSRAPGVSVVDLKKAERALGVLFPDEYKDLFLQTNGAQFGEWSLYPVPTRQAVLQDIVRHNEKRPVGLPDDLICIGENLTGDKLCYRIRKRFLQELVFRWNEKTGIAKYPSSSLGEFVDWHVSKRKTNQANRIGRFTVEGNELIVTDPYYGLEEGTDLQLILSNVKSGSWTAAVVYTEDDWVKQLLVFEGNKKRSGKWHRQEKLVGVDSALAGIFDWTAYRQNQAMEFETVVSADDQAGVVSFGAVSTSGFGDGLYDVDIQYDVSWQIVGVRVNFAEDE